MIIVLERGTTPEQTSAIVAELDALGLGARVVRGADKPLIHVFRGSTRLAKRVLRAERVEALVPTSGPRVRREGRRFYPYHFVNWSATALVTMGVLVALAGFFPPGLGAALDVQDAPPTFEQPWYLRLSSGLRGLFPGRPWLSWLAVGGGLLVLFLLPVLDRSRGTPLRKRWPALVVGGLLLLGLLYSLRDLV